jgi:hypothetical protein
MSARGIPEYAFNLQLAREIKQALVDAGFEQTVLLIIATEPWRGLVARNSVRTTVVRPWRPKRFPTNLYAAVKSPWLVEMKRFACMLLARTAWFTRLSAN